MKLKLTTPVSRLWCLLFSLLIGSAVGLSATSQFHYFWRRSLPIQVIILVSAMLLIGCLWYYLVCHRKLLVPQNMPGSLIKKWFIASLLVGIVTTTCFIILVPWPPVENYLEITATGQKNPASQGSTVKIIKVKANGTVIPLTDFTVDEGWEWNDGSIVSSHDQPSSIKRKFGEISNFEIRFSTNSIAGEVQIKYDWNNKNLDLYEPDKSGKSIVQISPYQNIRIQILLAALFLANWITSSLFFWFVGTRVLPQKALYRLTKIPPIPGIHRKSIPSVLCQSVFCLWVFANVLVYWLLERGNHDWPISNPMGLDALASVLKFFHNDNIYPLLIDLTQSIYRFFRGS